MSFESMDFFFRKYKNWTSYTKFVKLVTEMEDETFFNEKQSIRESARSLKKYGSISCNHMKRTINDVLIKHEINQNETLQGIALKYGCSMEQIRRANRLLMTDSIFVRQFLMIPVEKDSPFYPKDAAVRPQSLPPQRAATIAEVPTSADSKSMDFVTAISPEEENRKNMEEFLGKIDSSIASTKKYIAESQKNSEFVSSQSDDNIFSSGGSGTSSFYSKQRAYSTASSTSSTNSYQQYNYHPPANHNHHQRQGSSGGNGDTTHLIVMTQGRKVQSSLQKLEKQQDELFEL